MSEPTPAWVLWIVIPLALVAMYWLERLGLRIERKINARENRMMLALLETAEGEVANEESRGWRDVDNGM